MSDAFRAMVDGLVPFLEGLRSAGYRLEVGQILAARPAGDDGRARPGAGRPAVPADSAPRADPLAPLREQEDFAREVRSWGSGPSARASRPRPSPTFPCGFERSGGVAGLRSGSPDS